MYEWIQQLNFGNHVETLLAIILGFGTLTITILVVERVVSSFIDNEHVVRLIALVLVVVGVPLVLHFKLDYEIQPLMYIIIGIYSVVWLLKEVSKMFNYNNAE